METSKSLVCEGSGREVWVKLGAAFAGWLLGTPPCEWILKDKGLESASPFDGIITFTNHGCKVMAVTALPSVPCNFLSWQAKHTIRFSAG